VAYIKLVHTDELQNTAWCFCTESLSKIIWILSAISEDIHVERCQLLDKAS